MIKNLFSYSLFLGLMIAWSCSSRNQNQSLLIGIKTYETKANYSQQFSQWKQMCINTAFISKALLVDSSFNSMAHENNIKRFLIAPVFYNPEMLAMHPDWFARDQHGRIAKSDWVEFVCPTRGEYIEYLADSLCELVRTYKPDGVSLDFIRHFVFWELVHPNTLFDSLPQTCFCEHCQKAFFKELNLVDSVMTPELFARRMSDDVRTKWNTWRNKIITSTFSSISGKLKEINPDLTINLHAVPWAIGERNNAIYSVAGQSVRAISPLTNWVSPMCYHYMVHENTEWISQTVERMNQLAPGQIIPSIQVGNAYRDKPISVKEFEQALHEAIKSPSKGVVFWSWEYLEKEPEKIEAVIKRFNGNN